MIGSVFEYLPLVYVASDHLPIPGDCDLGALGMCDSVWVGSNGGLVVVFFWCIRTVSPILYSLSVACLCLLAYFSSALPWQQHPPAVSADVGAAMMDGILVLMPLFIMRLAGVLPVLLWGLFL